VRVEKHRDQNPKVVFFKLSYSDKSNHHTGDSLACYDDIVEMRNLIKELEKGKK